MSLPTESTPLIRSSRSPTALGYTSSRSSSISPRSTSPQDVLASYTSPTRINLQQQILHETNALRRGNLESLLHPVQDDDDDELNETSLGSSPYSYFASPSTLLCLACIKGDYEQVKTTLHAIIKQHDSTTALIRVITTLDRRHDMNALHLAVVYDHPQIVDLLIRTVQRTLHDPQSDLMSEFLNCCCGDSKHHGTPLMLATSVSCALILLQTGFIHIDMANDSGMTALHYAASTGNASLVSLFLYHDANPNAIDARGATPLHWAVFEGFQYTAMLLVGSGVDQSIMDFEQQTALMIASALGDSFLAKQLVLEGSPVHAVDKRGRTALTIAMQGGHMETVQAIQAGLSDRLVMRISTHGGAVLFFWVMMTSTQVVFMISTVPLLSSWSSLSQFLSLLSCMFVCGLYTYVWLRDPGYVPLSKQPVYQILECTESSSVPCPTCQTCKPLRSKHCSTCRRCVSRFDHHCPWLNNCIGQYNHGAFLWFLLFLILHCLLLGTCTIWIFITCNRLDLRTWIIQGCILGIALIFGIPTLVLLVLQLRNVAMNLTTNEMFNKDKYPYLKTPMDEFENPYDHGWIQNYIEVCIPSRMKDNIQ